MSHDATKATLTNASFARVEGIIDLEVTAAACQLVSFCRFASSEEQVQVGRSEVLEDLGSSSLYPFLSSSGKISRNNYRRDSSVSHHPDSATFRPENPLHHSQKNTSSNWTFRSGSGLEGLVRSPAPEPSVHSQSWAEADTADDVDSPDSGVVEVGIWDAVSNRPAVVDELLMERLPSY